MNASAAPAITRDAHGESTPAVLERALFTPISVIFAATAVGFALLHLSRVQVPYAVQVVPFAISVLLFGLPHGALDHLVPARLDHRVSVRRSITAVVALYALLGGATAVLWRFDPLAGFAAFIGVTWFHWGQGDLWLDRARGRATGSRADMVLTPLVRGALPMLVPLIAHPADYLSVLRATTGLIDPGAADGAYLLAAPLVRLAGAVVLAALLTVHLLLRHRPGVPLRATIAELAVLLAFFSAVPPVLAVGLYFTFWHAVRHIIRLELIEPDGRSALERGDLLRPLARFLRDALPVTLCALVLLGVVALSVRSAGLGTYLLLIAALTTPHAAVVTWMDRHRGRAPTPEASSSSAGQATSLRR
ncbi:MAG: beta-carotene 15,15'-dioxygenase, Brp/Blh family [Acidobacteria bacterium]|nr:beta-carotene 15,15'-dioxygenase, Brp/Blh family [Acidobacteriota bacterium]